MKISLKSAAELEQMRPSCRMTGEVLQRVAEAVRPGVTTKDLDDLTHSLIEKMGGKPSFLGDHGYPGSICISLNEEVIY